MTFDSDGSLNDTGSAIAEALGVSFTTRESSYRGGSYLLAHGPLQGEHIIVQCNTDGTEPAVTSEPTSPTVVYVDLTSRPEDVLASLAATNVRLVERTSWEPT